MWHYFLALWLIISIIIYGLTKQKLITLTQSQLYSGSSAFCFTSFLMAVKFSVDPKFGWGPKHTWSRLPYGTYPIWMFGFVSLAFGLMFLSKSFENDDERNK